MSGLLWSLGGSAAGLVVGLVGGILLYWRSAPPGQGTSFAGSSVLGVLGMVGAVTAATRESGDDASLAGRVRSRPDCAFAVSDRFPDVDTVAVCHASMSGILL